MALDPVFSIQHSVDPEPVQTRLLDHHQRIEFPAAWLCFLAEVCKAGKQASGITAGHNMTGNLFASRCKRRHQPGRFAKFQRDEDCSKVDPDSSRCFGLSSWHKHDWPQRNVERPISATAQVTIHSSWNLGPLPCPSKRMPLGAITSPSSGTG